jgi:pimeloyl-ACP methyl ester carboxylesterase
MTELDLTVDGRTLHVYDTGAATDRRLAVFWHHGTPNTGAPPEPLFATAARLGIRWVSYDRPGYGGSTPDPHGGWSWLLGVVREATSAPRRGAHLDPQLERVGRGMARGARADEQ